MTFVHTHVHSMGSLLDGFGTPDEIAARVKDIGQPAVALTDHGTLSCYLKFYESCIERGVKPLIGMEAYLVDDMSSKDKDSKIYHIGFIARNDKGLKKLFTISESAWTKGFYKKPRIDLDLVRDIARGDSESDIIALSGCIDGLLSQAILAGEDVDPILDRLRVFEHLFIEVQPWNSSDLNQALVDLADKNGLPLVATADAHYAYPEDKEAAEVALLLSQLPGMKQKDRDRAEVLYAESRRYPNLIERINFLWPNRKLRFDRYQNYLLTYEQMKDLMRDAGVDREDVYTNSVLISDMCDDLDIELHQDNFPVFEKKSDSDQFLRELAYERLERLGLSEDERYRRRLEDELDVVIRLGFSNYFLVIWDMVHHSRASGIMVGPGRGSVGGSLLAYILGVTEIDPVRFNLLFWRFLNLDIRYNPRFGEMIRVER